MKRDLLNDILKAAILYETYDVAPEDKSYLKDYEDLLKKRPMKTLRKNLREAFHVCNEIKAKHLVEMALKKYPIEDVCDVLLLLIEETERVAYGPAVFQFGIKTWVLSYVMKDYEIMRYLYHEVLEKRLKPRYRKKVGIAVLEPDMHEYGAIYGQIALELAGFKVVNLGYNLKPQKAMREVAKQKVDVLVLTSILSDPYNNMAYVAKKLHKKGKPKVVISGTMPFEIVKQTDANGYINCIAFGPKVIKHVLGIKKYTEEEVPVLYG